MRYSFDEPGTGGRLRLLVDEPDAERKPYRDAEGSLLTIAWNRGPAQAVCFERASQLVVWEFNGKFYCIEEHDRAVSCAGLLFYGSQGPLMLEPGEADTRRLSICRHSTTIRAGLCQCRPAT